MSAAFRLLSPLFSRLPVSTPVLALTLAWAAPILPIDVHAGELWVSDEIVVDPGTRSYDPYGFRTRVDLCKVDGRLTATWATDPHHGGQEAQIVLFGEDGQSDGVYRRVNSGTGTAILQVVPLGSRGWGVLQNGPDGLVFARLESLGRDPVETLLLDAGPVVTRLVHTECVEGSLLFVWGSDRGEVKRAWVLPEFVLEDEVEILGTYTRGLDLEFGEDGGILAWAGDREISYILLGVDGRDSRRELVLHNVSVDRAFSAARAGSQAMFLVVPPPRQGVPKVLVVDASTGTPRRLQEVDVWIDEADEESQIASGPEGIIVVGAEGSSALLDPWGNLIAEPAWRVFSWSEGGRDGHEFDAAWTGSEYLVVGSELLIEVTPGSEPRDPESTTGAMRYCYVFNRIAGRRVAPSGEAGPILALNEVFAPGTYQPWFSGSNLQLLLEDYHSNEVTQMRVPRTFPPYVIRALGGSHDCNRWVRTRMGVASGTQLTTLRWIEDSDRWGDQVYTTNTVFRHQADGSHSGDRTSVVGNDWDLAVVGNDTWVVSDYRPYGGIPSTRAWSVATDTPRELDPPASGNSQIIALQGRPYAVWRQGAQIYGAFVPAGGGDAILGNLLHEGEDVYLYSAANGGPGALVVFRDRQEAGATEDGLFALPIGPDGTVAHPASLVATARPSSVHALWSGERFFVAWSTYGGSTFRIARVGTRGTVYDPGGIPIESDAPSGPILAAGTEGSLAVAYGGNRVRFLADDLTPVLATGPFARSTEEGIELSRQLCEGEVLRVEVERAEAGELPHSFAAVGTLSGDPIPETFLDTHAAAGTPYLYQVRLVHPDGGNQLLGPVEATYAPRVVGSAGLTLRPNPTRGRLELSLGKGISVERIEFIDVLGRICVIVPSSMDPGATPGAGGLATWDLSEETASLPSGTYWVRVVGPGMEESRRIQILR